MLPIVLDDLKKNPKTTLSVLCQIHLSTRTNEKKLLQCLEAQGPPPSYNSNLHVVRDLYSLLQDRQINPKVRRSQYMLVPEKLQKFAQINWSFSTEAP